MAVKQDRVDPDTIDLDAVRYMTPGHPGREEIRRDPYPFYDRLRSFAPVFRTSKGPILITGYEESRVVLKDPSWRRDARVPESELRISERVFLRNFAFMDPPDHTRLRRVVSPAFTPKGVERFRQLSREVVNELLGELAERDRFDFLHDFALLVPLRVICRMIGIPSEDQGDFIHWAESLLAVHDPSTPPEVLDQADRYAEECLEFFRDLIASRRSKPADDLLTRMIEIQSAEPQRLTDDEIATMCILLHTGGHETTGNLMTNGMYQLIRHPDAYRQLRENPSLVPNAVEEMLRYDSPPRNSIIRHCPDDAERTVGDVVVRPGEVVYSILGAANRDPRRYPDPNTFDIRRDDVGHLAFSGGIHVCLGSHLARLESQECFRAIAGSALLEPATDEVVWKDSFLTRALERLPVRWAT